MKNIANIILEMLMDDTVPMSKIDEVWETAIYGDNVRRERAA